MNILIDKNFPVVFENIYLKFKPLFRFRPLRTCDSIKTRCQEEWGLFSCYQIFDSRFKAIRTDRGWNVYCVHHSDRKTTFRNSTNQVIVSCFPFCYLKLEISSFKLRTLHNVFPPCDVNTLKQSREKSFLFK